MSLKFEEVKNYLRVDLDEDDSFIQQCMQAATGYLVNAVDGFEQKYSANEKFEQEADSVILLIVAQLYSKRDGTEGGFPPLLRYLITQLQVMTVTLPSEVEDDDKTEPDEPEGGSAQAGG